MLREPRYAPCHRLDGYGVERGEILLVTRKDDSVVNNLHGDMALGEVLGEELSEHGVLLVGDDIYLIEPWRKPV